MDLRDIATRLIERARHAGATASDAMVVEHDGLDVGVRLGETEKLQRSREKRIGLRVFVGQSTAVVSSADVSPAGLDRLAEDACALAGATAPDPHAGLPDATDLARDIPDLDLWDPSVETLAPPEALAVARAAETAARDVSPEITNSEGAEFGCGGGHVAYATSSGFLQSYASSRFGLSVSPIATRDGAMQRDSWWTSHRKRSGLDAPELVGRTAATRALRRLGARRIPTGEYPVVFDPHTAASLLGHIAGAIAGPALYRGASWLVGRLGETIASDVVTIIDDPLRPSGPASRPFDGEGLPSRRQTVVERGVLHTYLLDTYSARRLGMRSTGHATRGTGDGPTVSPTNFSLEPGPHTPEAIIASIDRGLYVTELIGFGVNGVTGDYSRGAVGLWIEGGELSHAVEEVTIAGNLLAMLRGVTMVGNDREFRGSITAPTVKIERLTVAGT